MTSSTLAQTLWPSRSATREVTLVLAGAALTAVCAQIQIPWEPVPFTLQTLAVMLCGLTMGKRIGAASQLVYLAAGAGGLPIFAGASTGLGKVAGPTGGYLVSFVVVAMLLGWLSERGWTKSFPKTAVAFALGILINLGLGTLWLSYYLGDRAAFAGGFAPFVGIEIAKAAIVAPLLPIAWHFVGRRPV